MQLELDALKLHRMHSGHLCLDLTEVVAWDDFEAYAARLARQLGAEVVEHAAGVDMKMAKIEIEGRSLSLWFQDYPQMVSLEASSADEDQVLERITARLSSP